MVGQAQTQTEALFVNGSVTCEIVTEYDSAPCVIMTTTFLFLRKYKGENPRYTRYFESSIWLKVIHSSMVNYVRYAYHSFRREF